MAPGSFLGAKKRNGSENLVALAELRDVFADGFDFPGHLLAQYLDSFVWPQEAEKILQGQPESGRERKASRLVVADDDRCRMDSDQDFVVLGRGFFYLSELENIGRAVFFEYDCFHYFGGRA
jgi:hypothetical protein